MQSVICLLQYQAVYLHITKYITVLRTATIKSVAPTQQSVHCTSHCTLCVGKVKGCCTDRQTGHYVLCSVSSIRSCKTVALNTADMSVNWRNLRFLWRIKSCRVWRQWGVTLCSWWLQQVQTAWHWENQNCTVTCIVQGVCYWLKTTAVQTESSVMLLVTVEIKVTLLTARCYCWNDCRCDVLTWYWQSAVHLQDTTLLHLPLFIYITPISK